MGKSFRSGDHVIVTGDSWRQRGAGYTHRIEPGTEVVIDRRTSAGWDSYTIFRSDGARREILTEDLAEVGPTEAELEEVREILMNSKPSEPSKPDLCPTCHGKGTI